VSEQTRLFQLGLLNSTVFDQMVKTVYPEGVLGSIRANDLAILPVEDSHKATIADITLQLVEHAKQDWHSVETSTGFAVQALMAVNETNQSTLIENDFAALKTAHCQFTSEVETLESTLNQSVNVSYDMADSDISPVAISDLSFYSNPYVNSELTTSYDLTPEQERTVFNSYQSHQMTSLLSFFVGCVMGRYSSNKPGLIYADAENKDFKTLCETDAYGDILPDDDGIVPLANESWIFDDDATGRFREFVKTVWGGTSPEKDGNKDHLRDNLEFVAESLCLDALKAKKDEGAMDTIRRYFSTQFFNDHCKAYKRRPIYWLFSSGKEKAFECLVYLDRYNEGTLARMRTEYVTPLLGKYEAQYLLLSEQVIRAAGTELRTIEKDLKALTKKQAELRTFDEQLKHYADMRISLNLDDGVKVNYGKFGNLLADVKNIHGVAVK
jgi:hypothetical protein